jgi:ABC-type transport system involved in cytochrome c biogenesis permease subunit
MAVLFIVIDLVKPATMDQTLMPALQSVWFVPHVIVYILAYALLGMSAIFAGWIILNPSMHIDKKRKVLINADNLVYIGFSFLTLGLVFGALWAKEAWGHYWTWDPKETWAFITWMTYLIYIHFRYKKSSTPNTAAWILALSFAFLLICWMGVNYLPSASNSVHTY